LHEIQTTIGTGQPKADGFDDFPEINGYIHIAQHIHYAIKRMGTRGSG
jgi:hypothetical protein